MMNGELTENYIKNTVKLEKKFKYSNFYKIYYNTAKLLLRLGVNAVRILPFLVTGSIFLSGFTLLNHSPFILDENIVYANELMTYYSNNYQTDVVSFDKNFNTSLKHTTKWEKVAENLYERKVTSYYISEEEIINEQYILSLSKEELDRLYKIINVETIIKDEISNEEKIYNENMTVLGINKGKSKSDYRAEEQNAVINIFCDFLPFLFLSITSGSFFLSITSDKQKEIYEILINRLYKKSSIFYGNKHDEMNKILELRKNNLELLEEDNISLKKVLK